MKKPRFVLIDSNSLVHRAYHAYPMSLVTSKGEQVNAIYGFSSILLSVIELLKPSFLVCIFDVPKPTIRHLKFAGYKKGRKPIDKELIAQFPIVKRVIKAFDIPILEVEGFEADDVIGTLENDKKMQEFEKVIVTGDQDLLQLIDDDTKVFLSGKTFKDSQLLGEKDVKVRYGLTPSQIVDYKALYGDPSDNIPGVRGVGKKGAVSLIQEFGSLKSIYNNLDKIKGRYRSKLEDGVEQAFLSYDLAKIIQDVPVHYDVASCEWGSLDPTKIRKVFQDLEFRSLLQKLSKTYGSESDTGHLEAKKKLDGDKFFHIKDDVQFHKFLLKLRKQKKFGLHLRTSPASGGTSSSRVINVVVEAIAVSWGKEAYIVNSDLLRQKEISIKSRETFKKILGNPRILKVGFDLKSSIHALRSLGIVFQGSYFDIKVAAYLLQSGHGKFEFSDLMFNHLGEETDMQLSFDDGAASLSFLGREVQLIWRLYRDFEKKFLEYRKGEWDLQRLFNEVEMPLVEALARVEQNGILLDKNYLKKFSLELDQKIRQEEKEIFKYIGHEFNIASPKQVAGILFEELDLSKPRKTKAGNYSTSSKILDELRGSHPVVEHILKYRELAKLRSTYTTSLLEAAQIETGRVHSTFHQAVTATGRLSSSDPNLQNIPIASSLGRNIRKAFVAEKNSYLISFDYSQQELRILAHLAGDRSLIKAFEKKIDVHVLTASRLFSKEVADVTKKERGVGKTINFGIMYGMGPRGLSSRLKIPIEQSVRFIQEYFEQYPYVRKYFDDYLIKAEENGYAETLFGRRRLSTGLSSSNRMIKSATIRELTNFPIQGSAADMMKLAMIRVDKLIQSRFKENAKMILQIHDELVFEFKGSEKINEFTDSVKGIMETIPGLNVPLQVEVGVGKNLEEIH